ncbi:trans-aconitate methyltransferase [Rubidibacter lacunae KORDI 51-2]|uniref:Trans-aconitate methyltransferase n=1 Tax=Rubidibacter lacunae KORDI 51-2 TaxID=582515 RepID=U5DQ41_9CHRO|nr:methyltransferase domain-containing protein [Rubidibacter lacunae]ERN41815.1 trans-aconitate methyltransferase [Rubidibacter lacunae KORDI 51-2]
MAGTAGRGAHSRSRCGTGQLTAAIAAAGATVLGLDNSPDLIARARANYPELEFAIADGTRFTTNSPFDAVFYNAALHWMQPPDAVIDRVWRALIPGGRFVVEFGGRGNLDSIVEAIASIAAERGLSWTNPWYFPSVGEYASLLEARGFEVELAMLFERPTTLADGEAGLRHWLQMFGGAIATDETADAIAERLRTQLWRKGAWIADYRRLRVVARREQ